MKIKKNIKKSLAIILSCSLLISNGIVSLAKNVTAPGNYGYVYNDEGYNTNLVEMDKPTFTLVDKNGSNLPSSKYYKVGSKYYVSGDGYVKIAFSSKANIGTGWYAGKTVTITDDKGINGHIAETYINNGIVGHWMFGIVKNANQIADINSKVRQTSRTGIYSITNYNKIKVLARASGSTDPEATISAVYDMSSDNSKIVVASDTSAPTITSSVSGTSVYGSGNLLWYLDSATVQFTASDTGGSGLKAIMVNNASYGTPASFAPTSSTTYSAYSIDNVGNTSLPRNVTVYVDNDNPVISSYTRNSQLSTSTTGVYDFTFTDASSGIDSYAVSTSATVPAASSFKDVTSKNSLSGVTSISFTANGKYYIFLKDRVGHVVRSSQINVVADGSGPVVTSKVYDTAYNLLTPVNSWYTKLPAILRINAVDDSNIAYLDINGIRNTPATTMDSYYVDNNITTDGKHIYSYITSDGVGNTSEGNATVKVDTVNPYDLKFAINTTTPTSTGVGLTISAKDAHSGIANIKFYIDTANNLADIDENTDLSKLSYNWVDATNIFTSGQAKSNPIVVGTGEQGPTSTSYNLFVKENGIYRYSITDIAGHTVYSTDADPSGGIILVDDFDSSAPVSDAKVIGNEIFTGISVPYTNTLNTIQYYNANTYLKVIGTDHPSNVADKNYYSGIKSLSLTYNAFIPATYDADGNMITQSSVELVTDSMSFPAKTLTAEYDFFISDAYDQTFTYNVDDHANNKATEAMKTVYLDKDAPESVTFEAKSDLTQSVTSTTGVQLSTSASDKVSGLRYLILMRSGEDGNFTEYARKEISTTATTLLNGTNDFKVTENGYYKVRAVDNVGNVYDKDDKIIPITNIDDNAPSDVTIESNTTEWVNEDTGVMLTSSATDEGSGIASITTWGLNHNSNTFETLKTTGYTMIKESNSDNYKTHENNEFLASAKDVTGNETRMPDDAAIEVTNIDPVSPTVDMTVGSGVFGTEGCPIKVTASDKESGLRSLTIQRYEGNDEWVDVTEDSTAVANVYAVNKVFSNNKSSNTATQSTTFYVKENGTYRILADDVVLNETASTALTVSGVDSTGPIITVSGNPTDWTKEDAIITIKAVDKDGHVADISIDGTSQSIVSGSITTCKFTVSQNGTHEIVATDDAGNSSSYTLKVTKIDKTAPTVTYKLKNYNTQTKTCDIVMEMKDDLSGVSKAYLNNFKLTVDGSNSITVTKNVAMNNIYTCTVTDAAGNKVTVDISAKRKLVSIEVTTPPKKTDYEPGEDFDKTDMVVTAKYDDGSTQVITDYTITNGDDLKDGQETIKIKYSEGDVTVYTTTPITVNKDDDNSKKDDDSKKDDSGGNNTSNKSKNTKAAKVIQNVVTNDNSPLFILITIIILDILALAIIFIKRRRFYHK